MMTRVFPHTKRKCALFAVLGMWAAAAAVEADPPVGTESGAVNLLLNPGFQFHAIANSRRGEAAAGHAGSVPYWDQDAYDACRVYRAPQVSTFRPRFAIDNVVLIRPGQRLSQFILLAEVGLDPGDVVSLSVCGHQSAPQTLTAQVAMMQVDGAAGRWSPADFGMSEKGPFDRCARGELIPRIVATARSDSAPDFELHLGPVEIVTTAPARDELSGPVTIGLRIEFRNASASDLWIYAPSLCRGGRAHARLPDGRRLSSLYRHIPRTMQKLWRGEPLHILHAGYSSDCGDANPPLYLYDEDPASPTFKQPLERQFEGGRLGHPEWNDYIARWNFHFMQWGRLRSALLRKFDYSIDGVLLNTMACGGSLLAEAHSGFAEFASLSVPPGPANGHRAGKTWQELYPRLFSRPGGSGPDLVSLGFGKKSIRGDHDEIEQYEGIIRWFQRHYPGVEFVLTVNDWRESTAENAGGMRELSARYGIPFIDFGRSLHLTNRHYDGRNPIPGDAHPQAYAHDLWYRQIERLFEAVDPIEPGLPQVHLPDRISPHTLGWEGEWRSYENPHPRLRKSTALVLDDTVVNLWARGTKGALQVHLDGVVVDYPRIVPMSRRDSRNSTFSMGSLSLGDRHVVEVSGPGAELIAADSKNIVDRRWLGVENGSWGLPRERVTAWKSQWGGPYGTFQTRLAAGETVTMEPVGTFFSIAFVDQSEGGTLRAVIDGRDAWQIPTHLPYRTAAGEELWMENRKGLGPFPYGVHRLEIAAVEGPVTLLGVFTYDTRSNRSSERVLRGIASPDEILTFTPPFRARPLVICSGGLRATAADITPRQVTFSGNQAGTYEIVGE